MSPKAGRVLSALLPAVALAALLAVVAAFLGWERLLEALRRLQPAWLAGAGVLYLLLWVAKAWKWRLLLALDGIAVPTSVALQALLVANSSNLLVPAKLGDVVRGVAVRRHARVPFWRAMGSSILDRILDLSGALTVAGVALLAVRGLRLPEGLVTALRVATALGLLLVALLLCSRTLLRWLDRLLLHRLKATQAAMDEALRSVDSLRARPLAAVLLLVAAAAVWAGEGVCTVLVAHGAAAGAEPVLVILAVQVANLTKTLPITPGGVGPYEAALAAVLVAGGVDASAAAVVGLVDHALKNILTLLPAIPSASRLGLSLWSAPRPAAQD